MNFYKDRPVLVVGGLGFIGINVCRSLIDLGARLTVVTRQRGSRQDEASSLESCGTLVVESDIRDAAAMNAVVRNQDVVFNLAAQSGAVQSAEDPFTDLDVNCRGGLVLLEALRGDGCHAKLVFVGSRLEYGRVGPEPVAEDHATDPLCVHGVHKLTVEKYLRVYGRLFGLRYAIARITNPYGPGQALGQTAYGVINRMIQVAVSGGTLNIYGDGSQRRDYIFIDDVARALLTLGASEATEGRAYNVATGIGASLIDMARSIVREAGSGRIELVQWPPLAERVETGDFVADISRIRRDTDWEPFVTLADGLRQTVAFYRAHAES